MSAEEMPDEHEGAAVHDDILESILSHVPLIDLASSSSYVSRGWERAVSSSLSHLNAPKPWLLLFSHPKSLSSAAYDPRSAVWMDLKPHPPITLSVPLRSSHSTLLYTLTPSKFSFSIDPLHLTWHHVDPPPTWRTDPIVAFVAHRAVVVAGTCDFADVPPAVEIYDLDSKAWDTCDELPSIFAEYATATWFSIAVGADQKLHVMHRNSAATFSFDPMNKSWAGPYDLKPDPDAFSSIIGFAGGGMVVVGLLGSPEDVESVKIYQVGVEFSDWREIGEMPKPLIEKLQGESAEMSSIGMSSAGDFIFLHHGSDPVEVIQCEVVSGGCRWRIVPNTVVDDRTRLRRLVFTSSNVDIGDLQRALRSKSQRITVKVKDPNRLN